MSLKGYLLNVTILIAATTIITTGQQAPSRTSPAPQSSTAPSLTPHTPPTPIPFPKSIPAPMEWLAALDNYNSILGSVATLKAKTGIDILESQASRIAITLNADMAKRCSDLGMPPCQYNAPTRTFESIVTIVTPPTPPTQDPPQ